MLCLRLIRILHGVRRHFASQFIRNIDLESMAADPAVSKQMLISPPKEFDFLVPGRWPEWKKRFMRYRTASQLSLEEKEVQVSTLIYSMGEEAETIFENFGLNADEQKDFDVVLKKFDEWFIPKRNIIHERATFHKREQSTGETVEQFVRALQALAINCDYGTEKDNNVRDQLVVGLKDKALSNALQMKETLTLSEAITKARAAQCARFFKNARKIEMVIFVKKCSTVTTQSF